jgi:hypothetical protein
MPAEIATICKGGSDIGVPAGDTSRVGIVLGENIGGLNTSNTAYPAVACYMLRFVAGSAAQNEKTGI